MKRYTRFVIVMTLICSVAACGEPEKKAATGEGGAPAAEIGFFQNAKFIAGDGSPATDGVFFITENGKITKMGTRAEVPAPKGATHVDLAGYTVMPALINLHGHPGFIKAGTFSPDNYSRESVIDDLHRYAYYGVEYVAALGSDAGDNAFQIRKEQKDGKLDGARLFTAGRGITAKGGWPTQILKDIPTQVSNDGEARKAVDDLAAKQVDLVKIWVDDNGGTVPKLSPALYGVIIDQAKKKNLKVVAHVVSLEDAKGLVKAGVSGLVHSIRDREVDAELISEMKSKNVFLAPTLTAHESKFIYADKPSWIGEQSMREIYPAGLTAYLVDSAFIGKIKRDPNLPKLREQYALAVKNLKKMTDGGVTIVLGTDSGATNTFTGYFEHRELELMEAAGMSPSDVIKAGTSAPAAVLGMNDNGVLAVGKKGDFLVLTANPLEKARNTREIYQVYVDGKLLDRPGLSDRIPKDAPKITQEQRKEEAIAQADADRIAADAKLPHYGKFPLGESKRVAGISIPTPKYSTATVKVGPPHTVTVTFSKGSAADLQEFYTDGLSKERWQKAGNCFEKKNIVDGKTNSLCLTPANGQIVLNITPK